MDDSILRWTGQLTRSIESSEEHIPCIFCLTDTSLCRICRLYKIVYINRFIRDILLYAAISNAFILPKSAAVNVINFTVVRYDRDSSVDLSSY